MISQTLFGLISSFTFSQWARGYAEHHGACEDAYTARWGLFQVEVNHCFVLDHRDAVISIRFPTPIGKVQLGYVVCLGREPVRRSGFYLYRQKAGLPDTPPASAQPADDPFPF